MHPFLLFLFSNSRDRRKNPASNAKGVAPTSIRIYKRNEIGIISPEMEGARVESVQDRRRNEAQRVPVLSRRITSSTKVVQRSCFFLAAVGKAARPRNSNNTAGTLPVGGWWPVTADYRVRGPPRNVSEELCGGRKICHPLVTSQFTTARCEFRFHRRRRRLSGRPCCCMYRHDRRIRSRQRRFIGELQAGWSSALQSRVDARSRTRRVFELTEEKRAELRERLGVEPTELSPYHQLRDKLPPTDHFSRNGRRNGQI